MSTVALLGTAVAAASVEGHRVAPAAAHVGAVAAADTGVDLPRSVHGATALRVLGDRLADAADANDLRPARLKRLLRSDPTAWLARNGRLFFQDAVPTHLPRAGFGSGPAAAYPLADTFTLHSKPGSRHTIYLDFNGGDVSGTAWSAVIPESPTNVPAWDPSQDGPTFSAEERTAVQMIWSSVAEDYAAYDIDVTTQDPGPDAIERRNDADDAYGALAMITPSDEAADTICDVPCSGVAWVGDALAIDGDDWDGYAYGAGKPSWIFPQRVGNDPKVIADVVSHEVGHTTGLLHDGLDGNEYYQSTGSWAPIMGAGFQSAITQWSDGSYLGATNLQDDVATVAGAFGWRADETSDSIAGAAPVPTEPATISRRADVDTYLLGTCTGDVSVAADARTQYADLDIELTLLDSTGTPVAVDDPPSSMVDYRQSAGMNAEITQTLPAGTYYVSVDGTGGPGYNDYGSLGAYSLDVLGDCDGIEPTGTPAAAGIVTATPGPKYPTIDLAWAAPADTGDGPVTGYVVKRDDEISSTRVGAETTSLALTGLQYETAYTFTVTPLNAKGPGTPTTVTATTAPYTPPTVPRDFAVSVTPDHHLHFSWTPPEDLGGAALKNYAIYINGDRWMGAGGDATSATTPWEFAPGTWNVELEAVNRAGASPRAAASATILAKPANDAFGAARVIEHRTGSTVGSNTNATAEPGEPAPSGDRAGVGGASVWYRWTSPTTGPATFSTTSDETGRDTTLSVFKGADVAGLALVASDDDSGDGALSSVTFDAQAGSTYAIAVDGYPDLAGTPATPDTPGTGGGAGAFGLEWEGTAVPTTTTLTATGKPGAPGDLPGAGIAVHVAGADATVPSGNVDILDGGVVVVQTSADQNGDVSLVIPKVAPGDHSYSARFTPMGDDLHAGSTSVAKTLTMPAVPTTTSLNATVTKRSVTVAVQVTSRHGIPQGTVDIRDGGVVIDTVTLLYGVAKLTLPAVDNGTHGYSAVYRPLDPKQFDGSTSPVVSVLVSGEFVALDMQPTVDGSTVTLAITARAATSTPAGTVEISEGGTTLDTVTLVDGQATYVVRGVLGGDHTFRGRYVPATPDWAPIVYDAPARVAPTTTTTTLATAVDGHAVSLTATVIPAVGSGTPSGYVTFTTDMGTYVGGAYLAGGTATVDLVDQPAGTHVYRASYNPMGGGTYAASVSSSSTVEVSSSPTVLTVTDARVSGDTVTLSVDVTSPDGTPEGYLNASEEGGAEPTPGVVTAGTGTIVMYGVSPGAHHYTVAFEDFSSISPTWAPSSTTRDVTVDAAPTGPVDHATATTLTAVASGHSITLTATVTSDTGPQGSVAFYDDDSSSVVGFGSLVNGSVATTLDGWAVGTHRFHAVFTGNDGFSPSESRQVSAEVLPAATTTSLAASANGTTVTLSVGVRSGEDGLTGLVDIRDGDLKVLTAQVTDGTARVVLADVAPGSHSYTARFVGVAGYAASTSAVRSLAVVAPKSASRTVITAPSRARAKSRPTVKVTVTRGGRPATGTLVLSVNGKRVTLTLRSGTVTYRLPSLTRGTTKLVATYAGNASTKGSSAARAIRVG